MNHKTEQDFIWDTLDEIFPNTTSDIYPNLEQNCTLDTELREKESYMIRDALNLCDYNQTHTASADAAGTNLLTFGVSIREDQVKGYSAFQIWVFSKF